MIADNPKLRTQTCFETEASVNSKMAYSRFSRDITAAMLVYRTIAKKSLLGI